MTWVILFERDHLPPTLFFSLSLLYQNRSRTYNRLKGNDPSNRNPLPRVRPSNNINRDQRSRNYNKMPLVITALVSVAILIPMLVRFLNSDVLHEFVIGLHT